MFSQSAYPIQRVEGRDTVVVMTRAQAVAMNNKFTGLKKEIDSISRDYNGMKCVSDSLATENMRNIERLRKSMMEPKAAIRKVNDQWIAGIALYAWSRFVFFVLFEQ